MKKFLSFLLCFAFLININVFAGETVLEETEAEFKSETFIDFSKEYKNLLGLWYFNGIKQDGKVIDYQNFYELGIDLILDFKDDGTVVLTDKGITESGYTEGTWSFSNEKNTGKIFIEDNETISFNIKKKTLSYESGDNQIEGTILFKREKPEIIKYKVAAVNTKAKRQDYDGIWYSCIYVYGDDYFPTERTGLIGSIDINKNMFDYIILSSDTKETSSFYAKGSFYKGSYRIHFEDTNGLYDKDIIFELRKDGTLTERYDNSESEDSEEDYMIVYARQDS